MKMQTFSLSRACSSVAMVAAIATLAACGHGEAKSDDAPLNQVRTVAAKAGDSNYELVLPARALPWQSAKIFPRATGFVAKRLADIGDKVAANQVLALISSPETDQSVSAAKASVASAQAQLAQAQASYERAASMVKAKLISQQDYDSALATRDSAKAALNSAQAQLASAQSTQGFETVRAPFAGTIAVRNIDRGDRVVADSASTTIPMYELNALDPLRIAADVPQSAALDVAPGLTAKVEFNELPGQQFDADVVRSAQSISDAAGGMRIELRLANPGDRLPAGMIGEVHLKVPRSAPAVLVPVSAVQQGAGGARVARVKADATLEFAKVVLGRNLGGNYEIVKGLEPGDTVVLSPNALLADGDKVVAKPLEEEKKPDEAKKS